VCHDDRIPPTQRPVKSIQLRVNVIRMKCADASCVSDTTATQEVFCSLDIHDSHHVDVYASHDHPVFSDLSAARRANGRRLARAPVPLIYFEARVAGDNVWNGWDDDIFMYLDGLMSLTISTSATDISAPYAPQARESTRSSITI
jgi:hypothetical protein